MARPRPFTSGPWRSVKPIGHPLNQDAVNLVQNYAAFLQEVGRHLEADAVKARAAVA